MPPAMLFRTGNYYDPENQSLSETFDIQSALSASQGPPYLTASRPEDGTVDVPLDTRIAMRFSKPLLVETVNAATVTLSGPDGSIEAKVIPTEEGRLAFLTPDRQLAARHHLYSRSQRLHRRKQFTASDFFQLHNQERSRPRIQQWQGRELYLGV